MRNKRALCSVLIPAMVLLIAGSVVAEAQTSQGVPPVVQVYVVGEVSVPQAIPFKTSITLTQAVAMAGSLLPRASLERIRILRHHASDNIRTVMVVGLKAISKRQAADICLQPYDIIEVVSKGWSKRLKKECPHPPCSKTESIPSKYQMIQ